VEVSHMVYLTIMEGIFICQEIPSPVSVKIDPMSVVREFHVFQGIWSWTFYILLSPTNVEDI
jgi:hypothetical protein